MKPQTQPPHSPYYIDRLLVVASRRTPLDTNEHSKLTELACIHSLYAYVAHSSNQTPTARSAHCHLGATLKGHCPRDHLGPLHLYCDTDFLSFSFSLSQKYRSIMPGSSPRQQGSVSPPNPDEQVIEANDNDVSEQGDSDFDHDAESSTASITSSILQYRTLHGRTYHSERGNAQYW
jgi:hypothetical protein